MALIRPLLFLLLCCGPAAADVTGERRAQVNYMLHCQGCHLPEAEGMDGRVPPMKDFVGFFLHSKEGRDFLIRVPGVASAALNDEELAELMNWLVRSFSAAQLPEPFTPYSDEEVGSLRADPERDPEAARRMILAALAKKFPDVRASLDDESPGRR